MSLSSSSSSSSLSLSSLSSSSSSSLSLSLPDLNESFPFEYSNKFNCSEANLEEVIEKVASFTSKVYATILGAGKERKEQLKKEGMLLSISDYVPLIPESECEQFERTLKEKIITVLNQEDEQYCIELTTDIGPEKILYEIAKSVFKGKYELGHIFPSRTRTSILLAEKRTELHLEMRFNCPRYY